MSVLDRDDAFALVLEVVYGVGALALFFVALWVPDAIGGAFFLTGAAGFCELLRRIS